MSSTTSSRCSCPCPRASRFPTTPPQKRQRDRGGSSMQYRQLGRSGLRVSTLTLGTMTFGGHGPFAKVGTTDVAGATRLIDQARDAGVNLVDTANIYSAGMSEEIIGKA